MSTSPRLSKDKSQTTRPPLSAPMLLVVTALDTTWRAFLPTLGGTFAGIGLDNVFNITPIATIIGVIVGFILSAVLIAHQLITVRKS